MSLRDSVSTSLFPLLLASLLAALTFWLEQAAKPQAILQDGKARHDPDYVIDHFTVSRFDTEGKLLHTLRAETMVHFPDDDTTHVSSPMLIYHQTPASQVTASKALLNSDATHVQLIDNVRVTRAGKGKKADSILTTALLDAYPDEEIVTTKAPVTITQGASRIDGHGLQANNKSALYTLDGPVRAIIQPKQNSAPSNSKPSKKSQ